MRGSTKHRGVHQLRPGKSSRPQLQVTHHLRSAKKRSSKNWCTLGRGFCPQGWEARPVSPPSASEKVPVTQAGTPPCPAALLRTVPPGGHGLGHGPQPGPRSGQAEKQNPITIPQTRGDRLPCPSWSSAELPKTTRRLQGPGASPGLGSACLTSEWRVSSHRATHPSKGHRRTVFLSWVRHLGQANQLARRTAAAERIRTYNIYLHRSSQTGVRLRDTDPRV